MAEQTKTGKIPKMLEALQTHASDMDFGYAETSEKEIRDALKAAGLTTAALDPSGVKTAAEMEAVLMRTVRDWHLRCARKILEKLETTDVPHDHDTAERFVTDIRAQLDKAGRDITALDPAGRQGAAEIEERLAAGTRRMCLQKARHDFADFEKKQTTGWVPLIDHIIGRIRDNLARAGEPLSALDTTGAADDANIERRFAAHARRLKIAEVQEQLASAEKPGKYVIAVSEVARTRENIMKALDGLGLDITALDPAGKTTLAQMEERLNRMEKHLIGCGAMDAVQSLEKYARGEATPYNGAFSYGLRRLEEFIGAAGGVAQLALGEDDRRRAAEALVLGSYGAAQDEMLNFERMPAPKSLKEVDERVGRVAALFNRASEIFKAKAEQGEDPVQAFQQRVDKADSRARGLYYAAGGKIPVMRKITFGRKTQE